MAAPALTAPPRLDPFVLPAATTSRFLLLIVLAVAASGSTFDVVLGPVTWTDAYLQCNTAAQEAAIVSAPADVVADHRACFAGSGRLRAGIWLVGAALMVVASIVGHTIVPWATVRRDGLLPLDARVFPASTAEIERLMTASGLRRRPAVLIDPFRAAPGGRAFGHYPRYMIKLSIGTLRLAETHDPDALRAIFRHELSHLRNRDVDLTGLAVVAGWAFAVAVAVPLLLFTILTAPAEIWGTVWRLAAVLIVVVLVRSAVLRSREHYADVDASVGAGGDGDIGFDPRHFPDNPLQRRSAGRLGRLPDRIMTAVRSHPATPLRSATVRSPDRLLQAKFGDALATGITVGLIFTDLQGFAINTIGHPRYGVQVTCILLGALAATVVGTALWRDTLRSLATQRPLPTGRAPALGLAAGIVLGQILSPRQVDAALGARLSPDALGTILMIILLVGGCLIYTKWTICAAAAWLPTEGSRPLAALSHTGQVVGAFAFGTGLAVWITVPAALVSGLQIAPLALAVLGPMTIDAATLLPLLFAVFYPLCATLMARPAEPAGRRLLLDGRHQVLPAPVLRPWLVVGTAAALGAIAFVADRLVPDGLLRWGYASAGGTGGDFDVSTVAVLLVLAAVAMLLVTQMITVAVLTGGWASAGTGPVHALAAPVVGVFTVVVAALVTRLSQFCLPGDCDRWQQLLGVGAFLQTLSGIVLGVGVLVLPAVSGVRALARRLGGRRSTWPVGASVVADRRSSRAASGRRLVWTRIVAGAVALIFVVPVVASWAVVGLGAAQTSGDLPADVLSAAAAGPPGQQAGADPCDVAEEQRLGDAFTAEYLRFQLRVASAAATDTDPALRAMGLAQYENLRASRLDLIGASLTGLTNYCWVRDLSPT